MTPDDTPVPEDDAIAQAARGGLDAVAGSSAQPAFSWTVVQTRARRVQRRRLAAVVAAGAIVLLGAGTAIAAIETNGRHHLNIASATSTTGAPTTTVPPTYDSSSAAMTTIAGPPFENTTAPATVPQIAPPASSAPQVGDFAGSITMDSQTATPALAIGDSIEVSAVVHNTTDHMVWSSTSLLPTALATICTSEVSGEQTLWWMTNIPLPPGSSDLNSVGRTGTFRPTDAYAGTVTCELDVVTTDQQGTTFDTSAGGDDARAAVVGRVTGVPPRTFSVFVPSTTIPNTTVPSTTIPAETTTTIAAP